MASVERFCHETNAFAIVLLSLSTALPAQAPVPPDTSGKTASGTSYTQPKDWTVAVKDAATIFAPPEANLNIVVVEAGKAQNAQMAAAKAWSLYKPAALRKKVRLVTAATPGEGWDERVSIAYETSPSEKLVVGQFENAPAK